MSVQVETLEKNMAKLTVEVSEDRLEEALQQVYLKQRNMIRVPGFRKGKVPRMMIERMYGPEIFYEDAANRLIRENYGPAADESGLDIVSRAEIDVVQLEKGKPFVFTAEVAVRPEVKLGEYKGVLVSKVDTAVTEEEIDDVIRKEQENNARIITAEDRVIEEGDTAVIDYKGFVDGVAFEGGSDENHALEIGSHTFIDTFEDQLIGKKGGDEVEVNVVFPEEYHAQELAGKPAVFQVKIQEVRIKELPELDDEFAQDVSEFDTMQEYRENIRKDLAKSKEAEAKSAKENEAVSKIVEASEMELPEPMIEMQVDIMLDEFAQRIRYQGLEFEQYLQISGITEEKLKEQIRPDAVKRIQSSLVLEQIVKEENIQTTDEELEQEIERIAGMYRMEADKVKEQMGEEEEKSIRKDYAVQKAVDFILEHAVEE